MKPSYRVKAATWLVVLAVIVIGIGCSDDDPLPTEPDDPVEPPRTTETFMGTFGQDEVSDNTFTVVETGTVDLKITELEPVPTLTVGMGIGTWDESMDPPCTVFAADSRVVVDTILVSQGVSPGEYCVQVRDVGNVFPDTTVTYTVEVTHP